MPDALKKLPKWSLYVGGAILAYFAYRWYMARKSGTNAAGGGITLGTNLNSVLPSLSGGATGPSSGVGGSTVNETISIQAPSISGNGGRRQPASRAGSPMLSVNGVTPIPFNGTNP